MNILTSLIPYISADFRLQSLSQLNNLKPTDVVSFDNQLIPENYTIVAHLDVQTIHTITSLQQSLTAIDSSHYYYPTNQLHLTLLGNIDISIDPERILKAIATVCSAPMQFSLLGLGSNQYGASISAYPRNFSIAEIRKKLRIMIGDSGDDYSVHLQAYESVGWITFLRYLQEPKNELLEALKNSAETDFGTVIVNEISLYSTTSKVLAPEQAKLVETVLLN